MQELVDPFPVAEKSLMRRRDLLRRIDTKFVVPADRLPMILDGLETSYARLLAKEASWAAYETLYFDTPENGFFHDHRRGRLGRHKVRIRHYVDRGVTFFEVKLKSNRRITSKLRRRKEFGDATIDAEDIALGADAPQVPLDKVVPSLWTLFSRLQLVALEHLERVTIDLGVSFRHGSTESAADLDSLAGATVAHQSLVSKPAGSCRPLAIVEVKQPAFRSRTPIMLALRRAGVRRRRSSKYCTGVLLTNTGLRAHRFLPNLKQIARMQCSSS